MIALAPFFGYVETFGYSSAAGGWLFNGWMPLPSSVDHPEPVEFLAQFSKSQCSGRARLAFYPREDLDEKSVGVIAFVSIDGRVIGDLQYISFSLEGLKYQAQTGDFTTRLLDQEIVDRVRLNLLNQAFFSRNREHLLAITSRRGFNGTDTLATLSQPVLLEIDEAIVCPPAGLLIKGWHLACPGVVRSFRVRSGSLAADIDLSAAVRVDRPDVIAAVNDQYGFSENRCGFIAYVPDVVSSGDVVYAEVELEDGQVGFKPMKISKLSGLDAIKRILAGVDIRFGQIDQIFDQTIGPAIGSINLARLRHTARASEMEMGGQPRRPNCSVIIPLYGRIDFIEYQMALFSRQWDASATEFVYVLDDPPRRRNLEILARSAYERFRIPFKVLFLPENRGFSAASNIGLHAARGRYVCFLNSDVFPITLDWQERLIARLEQNPDIGVIGARLLFEDGSVQHEGCYFRRLGEYGNWSFIEHLNKGRRPEAAQDLNRAAAITGACMLLESSLARELGGFGEEFIIGDFEDSDLCLKAKGRGLSRAVDLSVEMYHLERQSQNSPGESWRMNMTLYNAWVHQRRWFAAAPLQP